MNNNVDYEETKDPGSASKRLETEKDEPQTSNRTLLKESECDK